MYGFSGFTGFHCFAPTQEALIQNVLFGNTFYSKKAASFTADRTEAQREEGMFVETAQQTHGSPSGHRDRFLLAVFFSTQANDPWKM